MSDVTAPASPRSLWTWRYVQFLFVLYTFMPEVRRLYDFRNGSYKAIEPLSIVPLVAQVLFVALLFRSGAFTRLPSAMKGLAWLWCGICGYGLVVGLVNGSGVAAIYDFGNYFLPFTVGLWVATNDAPAERSLDQLGRTVLILAMVSSAYGIYQYISPPPWDVLWLKGSGETSQGLAVAYQLRIFGTLNDTGSFAMFLSAALLFNVQRLRRPHIWMLLPVILCISALALTRVRIGWIDLLVGVIVYVVLAPGRSRSIPVLSIIAAATLFVIFNLTSIVGNNSGTNPILDRVGTFADVSNDASFKDRSSFSADALTYAVEHPFGTGFGAVGHGSKLNGNDVPVFDNGYLAHITEVGFIAGAAYFAVIIGSLYALVIGYMRQKNKDVKVVLSVAIAFSFGLALAETATDLHLAILGLFFWVVLGLAFRRGQESEAPEAVRHPNLGMTARTVA